MSQHPPMRRSGELSFIEHDLTAQQRLANGTSQAHPGIRRQRMPVVERISDDDLKQGVDAMMRIACQVATS